MDFDEKNSEELEAELYSRIHHEQPETMEAVTAPVQPPAQSRTVTKHSIVNNNKAMRRITKNRKKATEKCNPNPFAFASAMNNQIPKRLTPYTSYLSQVDSQPIDVPSAQKVENPTETENKQSNERRPNPFNQGFNRVEEKMKRYQQMQAKKAHANKVRQDVRQKEQSASSGGGTVQQPNETNATSAIFVNDSETDDDVYIYPSVVEEPTLISSDEEEVDATSAEVESQTQSNEILQDDDDINVDCDKSLSHFDDPFGGIDVAHLNTIIAAGPSNNVPSASASTDNFAKPQRTNRHSVIKRSYDVSEADFAAVDVYESESSDLPESSMSRNQKLATVLSESDCSDVDTINRSKRMRKRRKSGSNRGSDCISSDDTEDDDDDHSYLEPTKTNRPYYLHRGEGVFNAVTKYSKKQTARGNDQNRAISLDPVDSSDESEANDPSVEEENAKENWIVTDAVGETDDVAFENCANDDNKIEEPNVDAVDENVNETTEKNESNGDKDDENSIRSRRLVIHPEMGWNSEMKAFYNDSWGGETHNANAIRKKMPRDSFEWRLDVRDLRPSYNALKAVKCHNCRENGHRMAFCPQPKKEVVCFTCGIAGHRESRCPNSICLKCGEKANSYVRGCERCRRITHMVCKKCRRRGHIVRDCPDNWRAYHNTIDPAATPARLPMNRPKRFCSVCAAPGHRADQCYDFQLFMQDECTSSDVKKYEKVYGDDPIDNTMSTPYSMFQNPRENFKFVWDVNEHSDRIYGRFMAATGIRRDEETGVGVRIRKSVAEPNVDGKLVLNPMNVQNIRDKPKKQFAKNFYADSTTPPTKADQQSRIVEQVESAAAPTVPENSVSNGNDSIEVDNDVEMKEAEPTVATDDQKNGDDPANIESIGTDELMQEAIEVEQLRGAMNFSFSKEMDVLEKSKFDLSFIGSHDDHVEEINDSPTITSKSSARKARKAAEIEQLTEMEISLHKLNDELNRRKSNDDIVLNVSNAGGDHSIHCVHDSDSNYSFGEYFNETKTKEDKVRESLVVESPDYIPLPPHIDSTDMAAAPENSPLDTSVNLSAPVGNSAKIFLTKQHARLLLSTEAGNKLLSDASLTHRVKVRMDWENLGNVLIVVGTTADQNKFHADLIRFLVEMCKKMRIKNETFQQIPKSKVALIRFIREQFALLEQPLGTVNELYKNMKRNESLKSKNGTKNADRARKHLNIILMGRAGLREGRLHLSGLESNLKFLLENTKDMMTKQTREEIYQHYKYVFSPFEHDDYPDLISQYEEMKRAKSFPPLNIDKSLMEIKIAVRDDDSADLNRAKQKLLRVTCNDSSESPTMDEEPIDEDLIVEIISKSEPKIPTRELRNLKREPKTPKQQSKSPKLDPKATSTPTLDASASMDHSPNKNAVWSLKCKEIVEQCREQHIKSSKVVDKLNTVLEKASRNQLTYADYKHLEKIFNRMNRTVN